MDQNSIKYLIEVKGDYNDADYTTKITVISEDDKNCQRYLDLIRKVANAITNSSERNNWPMSPYEDLSVEELYEDELTREEINTFNAMFVPIDYEQEVHTLIAVNIHKVVNTETVVKRKYNLIYHSDKGIYIRSIKDNHGYNLNDQVEFDSVIYTVYSIDDYNIHLTA